MVGVDRSTRASILAIYGPSNTGKIERHINPLADTADTTLVCIDAADHHDGLTYRAVPSFGFRPVGLGLMLVVALEEVLRNDYDGVVSFSLFPHGCIALLAGRLAGLPVHLGILGIDLDVHARSSYRWIVRLLLRQFDAISVPGTTHRRQLESIGIGPQRTVVLANAIDTDRFTPAATEGRTYDFLWVGRFGPEKDPMSFVDALARLRAMGRSFRAVMLGDGPLVEDVGRALRDRDLTDVVDRPGWVDDPLPFYRRSKVFVLTSRRDALPLTLIEAMATGVAPVVPRVGNVTDVVEDGQTGVVLDDPDPGSVAASLSRLHRDDGLRERLAANATRVGERYSYDAARDDWESILRVMGVGDRHRRAPTARQQAG